MKFASALSTESDLLDLVQDLVVQIHSQLGPEKIDLALLFVHPQLVGETAGWLESVRRGIGARHLVGCTASGIIGDCRECEEEPAVALLVAQLPGVEVTPFHITQADLEEATGPAYWHFQLETTPATEPNFLVFLEPYSIHATELVAALATAFPGAPILGGLSSGGREAGDCQLFLDDVVLDNGAVGVALAGNLELRTVVSQGCRPIGQPLTITRADQNIIFELGGRPPLAVLEELLADLPASEQKLAQNTMCLGRVINEYQADFGRGDFVVRNLIGHDPDSGAMAIGDLVRTGQTVQFQVRDGTTAAEDLQGLLEREQQLAVRSPVRGAVLVSCLGRGAGMYGEPDHDINTLHRLLGPVPVAGFFANGEIGPVSQKPFIHGFTSVIGLFAERTKSASSQ